MKCPNCGAQIDDDSVFCISCGKIIEKGRTQHSILGIISFTIPITLLTLFIPYSFLTLLLGYGSFYITFVITFFGFDIYGSMIIGAICLAGLIIGIYGLIRKRGSAIYSKLGIIINAIVIIKIISQVMINPGPFF